MSGEGKIVEFGKGLSRIQMFGYDVLALISAGEKEPIEEILAHLQNGDVVHYLEDKYKNKMWSTYNNSAYNYDEWDSLFKKHETNPTVPEVMRDCEFKKDDGLLYVVSMILHVFEMELGL